MELFSSDGLWAPQRDPQTPNYTWVIIFTTVFSAILILNAYGIVKFLGRQEAITAGIMFTNFIAIAGELICYLS